MRYFVLLGSLLVFALAPAHSAAPTARAPAVSQDLRCFVLYTIAVGTEKDEKKMTGVIAGTWYFLGRLDTASPGFDIKQAMEAGLADLQANPKAEEIGKACDDQFQKRGSDMSDAAKGLEEPAK